MRKWCARVFSLAALALPVEAHEMLAQTPHDSGFAVIFYSGRAGNDEICTMAVDGTRQTRLTNTPQLEIFPAWSPDGSKIIYSQKYLSAGRMQGMIRVMNADGSNDHAVTGTETRDENGLWSPDGRKVLLDDRGRRPATREAQELPIGRGGRSTRARLRPSAPDERHHYTPLPPGADGLRAKRGGAGAPSSDTPISSRPAPGPWCRSPRA